MELNIGDKVTVYDGCLQRNVLEPIVKIVNGSYGELIYTQRENPLGYDERIIRRGDIKEHIRQKKINENAVEHPTTNAGQNGQP